MVMSRDSIKLNNKNKKFNFLGKLKKPKPVKVKLLDTDIVPLREITETNEVMDTKPSKKNQSRRGTSKAKKEANEIETQRKNLIEVLDDKAS